MVSRIYEYNHELIGEDLPENYIFCIFNNGHFDEFIDSNTLSVSTNSDYDVGSVLSIYQTDLSFDILYSIHDEQILEEDIPNYIENHYPNNEWTYIGQITISNDGGNEIILNGDISDVSLVINNKTVSNIINNSNNNKIVDSIVMGNTVIYQRIEEEKIDTTIRVVHSELWLYDINGNGLMNKTVIAKICSNSIIETISITTGQYGLIGRQFDIKEVTFEGDYEYNGCSYINPVFTCK